MRSPFTLGGKKILVDSALDFIDKGLSLLPEGVEPYFRRLYAGCLPSTRTIYAEQFAMIALRPILAAKKEPILIDGGANLGKFSRKLASLAPERSVLAYEPVRELAEKLSNHFSGSNVKVRQSILSDQEGETTFYVYPSSNSLSSVRQRPDVDFIEKEERKVSSVILDNEVSSSKWSDVAFIKLDVEGSELPALRGAVNILTQSRPFVLFERTSNWTPGYTDENAELHDLLSRAGLAILPVEKWVKGAAPATLLKSDFIYCCENQMHTDYLAFPI